MHELPRGNVRELRMGLSADAAQVWHDASCCVVSVAVIAMATQQRVAEIDLRRRAKTLDGWAEKLRINVRFRWKRNGTAAELECHDPPGVPILARRPPLRIGVTQPAAKACHDRDKLDAIQFIRHGSSHDARAHLDRRKLFPGVSPVHMQIACGAPLKDQATSGRHHTTTVPHCIDLAGPLTGGLHLPDRSISYWIPCLKNAANSGIRCPRASSERGGRPFADGESSPASPALRAGQTYSAPTFIAPRL
jgi:hypothetical protein